MKYLLNLKEVNKSNLEQVGGKNASLGEMIQNLSAKKINVPEGFATTTLAYKDFLAQNGLAAKIAQALEKLNTDNLTELKKTSQQIQRWIKASPFSPQFIQEVSAAYNQLKIKTVAVRSSATAEDLANASFAGQQETFLNIQGTQNVLEGIKLVFASLFTARAITYRQHQGFDSSKVAISAGIQSMVRSDKASSGVIFTLDTESGFDQVILITSSYGLGETIVQGKVNPDEFYVYKPLLHKGTHAILSRKLGDKALKMIYTANKSSNKSTRFIPVPPKQRRYFSLSDAEVVKLAQQAHIIEQHYGMPMDIEWAKDGVNGELYILQARPETVKSTSQQSSVKHFHIETKSPVLATGRSVGQAIGQGPARNISNLKNIHAMQDGEVLVTDMTDPDWEPVMKRAAAIVTNRGGRTCHAAIIARELGIPAVVGCGDATSRIKTGAAVTVSCAEGETGYVYAGKLNYQVEETNAKEMPKIPLKICLILGNPGKAFAYQFLPNDGVGLARLEFIISNTIGIHPNALLNFAQLPARLKQEIQKKTCAYPDPVEFYIERLKEGIATIAAAFAPRPVIFRFSDFKSNEYAGLLGGELYEPKEENPMLGFRGAARYIDKSFARCFELECTAFKRVRNDMGLTNAQLMVPFVRTVKELENTIKLIASYGLKRDQNGLKIYMMCEIPANALLAEEFLQHVDGFSIGSNDLTQLTLGLDRDSAIIAPLFDERNEAIKILLAKAITACNKANKYVGICGQAPSDHPDLASWLVSAGIQSISLNPDTIVKTWLSLANCQQGEYHEKNDYQTAKTSGTLSQSRS